MHVKDCIYLQFCASVESRVSFSLEEGGSCLTDIIVNFNFKFGQMFIAEDA